MAHDCACRATLGAFAIMIVDQMVKCSADAFTALAMLQLSRKGIPTCTRCT